jgi:hypothetical protein
MFKRYAQMFCADNLVLDIHGHRLFVFGEIAGHGDEFVPTFALNLLHAAALDSVLIRRISGSTSGRTSATATILRVMLSRPRPTS